MLQPTDTFYSDIAEIWVESMPNIEIAQHTAQNLFCRLPYASQKAYEWMASDKEMFQICGYLILARLFMQGKQPNERSACEFIDQAHTALYASFPVRRAALSAIQKYQTLNNEAFEAGEKILHEAGF